MVYSFCWSVANRILLYIECMLTSEYASCILTPEGCISVSVADLVQVICYLSNGKFAKYFYYSMIYKVVILENLLF